MARPKLDYNKIFKFKRETKFTPDTLRKLEEASSTRLSVRGICAHANIHHSTYYDWMKKVKGLSDRLDDLRENPITLSKRTIISKLSTDASVAFRYLEKEAPDEYGERLKLEHSGEIKGDALNEENIKAIEIFHNILKENIKKRSLQEAKEKGDI